MNDGMLRRWLAALPDDDDDDDDSARIAQPAWASRKRPRTSAGQGKQRRPGALRTPSSGTLAPAGHEGDEYSDGEMETPAKRAKARPSGGEPASQFPPNADDDRTPRPIRQHVLRRRAQPEEPASQSSESPSVMPSSPLSSSLGSGRKRRRRELTNAAEPININSFALVGLTVGKSPLSTSLAALLKDFKAASAGGRPVISDSRKAEVELAGRAAEDIYGNHFYSIDEHNREESPPVQDVLDILKIAVEYSDLSYEEAAWNSSVHEPLIKLAIGRGGGLLKLVQCTTARIFKDFLIDGVSNGKMVDFCLAFDPFWPQNYIEETAASRAVDQVRLGLPHRSINHTIYPPLVRFPVALSIETKRPSGNSEDAETQLGVWQNAQWKMLEVLVREKKLRQPAGASTDVDQEGEDDEGCNDVPATAESASAGGSAGITPLDGLTFLPSIYIVGHQWRFASFVVDKATGKSKRALWTDGPFGSTNSVLGIYQIIWCLRRLARYLEDEYWPWFVEHIL